MDTLLDEDQTLIRDSVREFLQSEAGPQRVRNAAKHPDQIDRDLWREFCSLGWTGLSLSPDAGGQGLPLVYLGILFEELGRHVAPVPALGSLTTALLLDRIQTGHGLGSRIEHIASGDLIVALALSDLGRVGPRKGCGMLSGQRDGDELVLDGTVRFVDDGSVAEAFLVSFGLEADGTTVPALVLVDSGTTGLATLPLVTTAKDSLADLSFEGVRVNADKIAAIGPAAVAAVDAVSDLATVLNVAMMAGGARRALEFAAEYAKERKAFGHPIGAFQAIQHLAADMLIAVDGTELLVHEAIWRMDHGLPAALEVSQAKAFANERCLMVCRSAQQIHGGIGFMDEFDLHFWYRRVLAWSLRWGTAREHRARVASALLDTPDTVRLDFRADGHAPAAEGAEAIFALAGAEAPEDKDVVAAG